MDSRCLALQVGCPDAQKLTFTGNNDNHKAYRLIDVDTDRLIFSRDVVFDGERGPFQLSSFQQNSEDQPLNAYDLGVCLPLGSPDGRDDANFVFDDALPEFPPDDADLLSVVDPLPPLALVIPPLEVGTSTLRLKCSAKTIGDLCLDELIEGISSRNKGKQQTTVNFALMANLHSIYEP